VCFSAKRSFECRAGWVFFTVHRLLFFWFRNFLGWNKSKSENGALTLLNVTMLVKKSEVIINHDRCSLIRGYVASKIYKIHWFFFFAKRLLGNASLFFLSQFFFLIFLKITFSSHICLDLPIYTFFCLRLVVFHNLIGITNVIVSKRKND
jgi:hypothetical protein